MPIKINEDKMKLELEGRVIAVATRRLDGWWEVTNWPRFFNRNQTITAPVLTELGERSYDSDRPLMSTLRKRLQ